MANTPEVFLSADESAALDADRVLAAQVVGPWLVQAAATASVCFFMLGSPAAGGMGIGLDHFDRTRVVASPSAWKTLAAVSLSERFKVRLGDAPPFWLPPAAIKEPDPAEILSVAFAAAYLSSGFASEQEAVRLLRGFDPLVESFEGDHLTLGGVSRARRAAALNLAMDRTSGFVDHPGRVVLRLSSVAQPWLMSAHEMLEQRMEAAGNPVFDEMMDWLSGAANGLTAQE